MKKPTKPCKLCGGKRYANLRICFKCYQAREISKRVEREQRRKERKENTKKFQKSLYKRLHKLAWEKQRKAILAPLTNFQGLVKCFTCDRLNPVAETHIGHFWHGKLDFDLRNLKPQCVVCNTHNGGKLAVYATRLVELYGQDWFLQLDKDAHTHQGYSIEDLKEIIIQYEK